MPLAKDLVQVGFSPGQAGGANGQVAPSVSAAGTVITDATDLSASINFISTVAASTGVQLYFGQVGDDMWVFNSGANLLRVYPPSSSHQINQIAAGSAHLLPIDTGCLYKLVSTTQVIGLMSR